MYPEEIVIPMKELRPEVEQACKKYLLPQIITIFRQQIQPVIILSYAKAGSLQHTKIKINIIIPVPFAVPVIEKVVNIAVNSQRKLVSARSPVLQRTLCAVYVYRTPT